MASRRYLVVVAATIFALCVITSAEQKVLYEKQSQYSTIIVTEDEDGLRTLWFEKDGAKQSVVKPGDPDHIELPYAEVMPVGLALVEDPQRVLIVGLGGGTIPTFLRKHYPRLTIDVVEIDPVVVEVAEKFFGFRRDDRMKAYVYDGRDFIELPWCRNRYDVIFLDAFGADNVPYKLATKEFLQAVRLALTPKGVVVGNIWSRSSNSLYDSMVRTYQEVFDELYILDVRARGNKILIALPRKERLSRNDMARRVKTVSRKQNFPYDMGDHVTYGYNYAVEKNSDGEVLLDKNKPDSSEDGS